MHDSSWLRPMVKFSPCFAEFNSYPAVFDVCHYIFCLQGELFLRVSYYCRSVNSITIINHVVVVGKHHNHKPFCTIYTTVLCYCKLLCFCTLTSYLAAWFVVQKRKKDKVRFGMHIFDLSVFERIISL